ncbi:ATP-binding response regulator [Vibrio sp. TRT 1302]|uniref:ATP-binding response regulator n=1 Tax=Vibrio sp. TRT 1302 TaxID=3418504 RepID=UPI003CF0A59B
MYQFVTPSLVILLSVSLIVIVISVKQRMRSNGRFIWSNDVISEMPSLIFLEHGKKNTLEACNCPYYDMCLMSGGCQVYNQINGREENVFNLKNMSSEKRCEFGIVDKVRVTKRAISNSKKILTVVDDVTREYEYCSALEKAHSLAEQAVQSRERFLATMSHELRTPIASMVGLLDLMSYEDRSVSDNYKLKSLMSSAKNLQLLVNDILDYSKLDSQGISLVEQYVSYTDLLGDLIRLHEASAREKGLVFETRWEYSEVDHILIDSLRLSQVVNNILSNAVKFTEYGRIKVTVSVSKQRITIIVDDTGIGISEDKLAFIFDPFRQADDSIERRYGGTGLGLAIVKRLTKLMSGDISINSVEGQSTSVQVSLPIKGYKYRDKCFCFRYSGKNEQVLEWFTSLCHFNDNCMKIVDSIDDIEPNDDNERYVLLNNNHLGMGFDNERRIWQVNTEPFYPDLFYKCKEKISKNKQGIIGENENTLVGLTVLIAEDNPINQYMLGEQMELLGVKAVIVSDGIEAQRELQINGDSYDMLITDVHMPKMDGISLVKWVRDNLNSFKNKPILGCTAEHSKSLRKKMLDFDDVILKPFEVKSLFKVLSSNKVKCKRFSGKNKKISDYISNLPDDKKKNLYKIYRDTMTKDLHLIESESDRGHIGRIAHKIKGGANSLGEFEIGDIAGKLESVCRNDFASAEELSEAKADLIEVLYNKLRESDSGHV